MKKIICTLLFLFITVFNLYAQPVEKKMLLQNEFYAAYGGGSAQEIGNLFQDLFASIFTFSSGESKLMCPPSPFIIGYKRILMERLGIGILASYTSINSEFRKSSDNSLVYTINNKFITVMARMDFYYVINEWVQMHSGYSFGIVNYKGLMKYNDGSQPQEDHETVPAFQINAFSLRVGKSFGGFFELGYGYNGIVNLGVSYKF